MSNEFASLTAVVTGGACGIGAAIATRLHEGGATVVVIDRDLPAGEACAVNGLPEQIRGLQADVTNDATIQAAIAKVVANHGGIDILVNNAGIGAQGTVADNSDDQWATVFDVNVIGMARVSRACLPYLRGSDSAAIVNVSSIAATAGLPQRALYSASKGAVLSLTRAMAADHIREGIRVNCVSPGTVDTPWVGRLLDAAEDPQAERAALQARQPHGRLVDPIEVASAVAYLADPRNSSTVGVSLAVDGGIHELRLRPQ